MNCDISCLLVASRLQTTMTPTDVDNGCGWGGGWPSMFSAVQVKQQQKQSRPSTPPTRLLPLARHPRVFPFIHRRVLHSHLHLSLSLSTPSFVFVQLQQQYYLPEPEDGISKKLPKEILFRIFSFLDVVSLCRCAQVRMKLHFLTESPSK